MSNRETEPDPFPPQEEWEYVVLEEAECCSVCGELEDAGYRDENDVFVCEDCVADEMTE